MPMIPAVDGSTAVRDQLVAQAVQSMQGGEKAREAVRSNPKIGFPGDDQVVRETPLTQEALKKTTRGRPSPEMLREFAAMVSAMNSYFHIRVGIDVHPATGRPVIAIIDKQSNATVDTIPERKLLDLAARIEELSGIVVDMRIPSPEIRSLTEASSRRALGV